MNAKEAIQVTFVSGGVPDAGFWSKVETFMAAATDDLDIKLEVLYANMNHIEKTKISKGVVERSNPPDYLIIDNYKMQGGLMIEAADAAGVRVFLMT